MSETLVVMVRAVIGFFTLLIYTRMLGKQQLSQRYGAGHEIKLVSMRRSGSGASVKVAVRLDDGKVGKERVEFASCQISRKELPEN